MPRCIDANRLKKKLIGWETEPTDEDIERVINRQPTADVIPIKWIEQYIENEIKMYGCEIPETNAIKNMLKDWRKENESNISD